MTRNHRHLLLLLGLGAAALAWATFPPSEIALSDACTPLPGPAQWSSALYPGPFWRRQLAAVETEQLELLSYPARRARLEAEAEAARRLSPIESKMERLSQEQGEDPAVKERHEAERHAARLKRAIWLTDCAGRIHQRLDE
jgi:hypothetical protein